MHSRSNLLQQWPQGKCGLENFHLWRFLQFPFWGWSFFFCCRNSLHLMAVYSLGFPRWPVIIPQAHITRMNRNLGSFSDTRSGIACCNLEYDDYWKYFEILGRGLLLTQKVQCVSGSAAVCVTSLPWLICCRVICKNSSQVLIALSFGGDGCGLLNPSPMASSPGFAGLAPLLPSPLCLVTHRDTSHIILCCTVAETA